MSTVTGTLPDTDRCERTEFRLCSSLTESMRQDYCLTCAGAVAQSGERVVRNDEVRGSIPLGSTRNPPSQGGCEVAAVRFLIPLPADLGRFRIRSADGCGTGAAGRGPARRRGPATQARAHGRRAPGMVRPQYPLRHSRSTYRIRSQASVPAQLP